MKFVLLLLVISSIALAQDWVELEQSLTAPTITDLEGWIVSNPFSQNYFTTSGGKTVIGGLNAFGKKTTASKTFRVPPHYQLRLSVQLWKYGNWASNRFVILVDGYQWETFWIEAGEKSFETQFTVPHDQAAVSVILVSLQEKEADAQSWGFRNVKLEYMACPTECGVCTGPEPNKCFMYKPVAMDWYEMKDKQDWVATGGNGKIEKSTCGGVPFYGGPSKSGKDTIFSKVYQDLPPHYKVKLQFQFWKVDSWDGDRVQLFLDKGPGWTQTFGLAEGVKICTLSKGVNPDKVVNVNYDYPHNFNAVRVEFQPLLQQAPQTESFGLRQISLWVAACAQNCLECTGPQPADCTQCMVPFVQKEGKCDIVGKWEKLYEALNEKVLSEPTDWTFSGVHGGNSAVVTDCGGVKLVGGYERFGKDATATRVWNNIPKHKRVKLIAEVWKIDAWDGQELQILFNGEKVWKQIFTWTDPGTADLCGASGQDKFFEKKQYVEVVVGHTDSSLEVKFQSNLQKEATKASWAFRNVFLWYEPENECASLYTECNYRGFSIDLCDQIPNFTEKRYPSKIKSIQVPANMIVTLYDENEFGGSEVEFSQSTPCIEKFNFNLAQFKVVKTE